ncbi:hypothetical protein MM239_02105 [Belliella sp. DSM 111904]|uniref:Uncharacterized protein n=1 Tax=Belliella filtrata TaxID=2923435 RepID=A0ABS9UW35_9BACT|nr:hypothetical protein [Belliella filtrata]MCH7408174.1 hypothetical protein [Belliella filtrata]
MGPEFKVLKRSFIKTLNSKSITIELFTEFEFGKLVSQIALSTDIDYINKEVIEGVKIQCLNKGLLKKLNPNKQKTLISDQLQGQSNFYTNAEEVLEEILKNKQYKHFQHIQYLAFRHDSSKMKIRFVLNPFSFMFLISSENHYFLILETLDTEEPTYIWLTPKAMHY